MMQFLISYNYKSYNSSMFDLCEVDFICSKIMYVFHLNVSF